MKKKTALTLNIIITVLTIFASILMFTGIKITSGAEPVLETTKLGMFKFYTVDSNMFMGLTALLFTILQITKKEITKNIYRLNLMATTSVGLTFLIVFTYLGKIAPGGLISLLQNSNLFFHLIIPVLSIINFTIFERTDKLKLKDTLYGIIPTVIYGILYTINLLLHVENGTVSPIYDWYWFVQNGIKTAFIVAPAMLLISYIISLILWKLNKRR